MRGPCDGARPRSLPEEVCCGRCGGDSPVRSGHLRCSGIHADLAEFHVRVGHERIGRLMGEAGLAGINSTQGASHDPSRSAGPAGAAPGQPPVHGRCARPPLAGGHHVRPNGLWLSVADDPPRCLQPPDGGLVEGLKPPPGTGPRRPRDCTLSASAPESRPPLRSGQPVHFRGSSRPAKSQRGCLSLQLELIGANCMGAYGYTFWQSSRSRS